MLGYMPAIIMQVIGVIIPFVGIIVLLRKGQGTSNMYLVMANFGALIMNWSSYLMLRSAGLFEALAIYKSEYVGSVIFVLFFFMFIKTFLDGGKKSKRNFRIVYSIFIFNELVALGAVVFDNPYAYKDVEYSYVEDNGKMFVDDQEMHVNMLRKPVHERNLFSSSEESNELQLRDDTSKGYAVLSWANGHILFLRYIGLTLGVINALVYSIKNTIKQKNKTERLNYIYLSGAEGVVLIALLITLFSKSLFTIAPLLISMAVLWVICGTASGNVLLVADMGRSWVLDHSESIFIILDREGRFLDANGYTRQVVPGLLNLPKYSFIPDALSEALFSDNSELEYDGHTYVKKVSDIEVAGRKVGYSITIVDMTEHYGLMAQIESERQKAIDANNAKSNFMSNMSHEIRTPMNAIVGMTEIMLRHEQDEFNAEYLRNIRSSGNALLSVVNDILDFSKIESGKLEIIPEEYEIMEVLNDLSLIFLNRIGDKPLELIYDIDPNMPLKFFGDPVRIRQILLNIVNNGIKYTDSGYVKLSMKVKRYYEDVISLECAVEDTGIGIKEEDLPKLFSTFSQVDTKRNRGKEGTGLGLSIAKQLVELMGGEIKIESEYGKGSTFKFRLLQKVVDYTPAVGIKRQDDIYVSGFTVSEIVKDSLKRICDAYDNVHYVEPEDVLGEKIEKLDFLFSDRNCVCEAGFTKEDREIIIKYNAEFVMIHNPMRYTPECDNITVVNAPIYTLNFCMAINHEVLSFEQKQGQMMSYTAPEARILVVDDNEMNRKVVAGLLEPVNCIIDNANDGKQAVAKVESNEYDLVLMDHMMPIMDGIEATNAIRAKEGEYYQKLPIIALSANALAEAREQFLSNGMNDFLAKPIKTIELFKIVRKYLPDDKIIEGTETVEEASASDYDEIPVIEGLDVAAGIENSGGLKLFNMLIVDYYKLIDRKAAKLEQYLYDGFIRDFTIEVHALKNTSRMIGALELSDMFYQLEQAGNHEDYDTIDRMSGPTIELFRSYKAILEPHVAVDTQEKEEVDTEEIISTLNKIKDCMDGFDLDGVDEAMKQLDNYVVPDKISDKMEELGSLITDVAMEEVIALCSQMIAELEG